MSKRRVIFKNFFKEVLKMIGEGLCYLAHRWILLSILGVLVFHTWASSFEHLNIYQELTMRIFHIHDDFIDYFTDLLRRLFPTI